MSENRKKTSRTDTTSAPCDKTGVKKYMESCATFGLILVAVALVIPFAGVSTPVWFSVAKWIYTAGAVVFTIARIVNAWGDRSSLNIRRLRRMEAWAGVAFCIGAFFWFYNASRFGVAFGFSLAVIRETIMFTLAGAMIQIIAVWLIYFREKKENPSADKK